MALKTACALRARTVPPLALVLLVVLALASAVWPSFSAPSGATMRTCSRMTNRGGGLSSLDGVADG